MNLLAFVEGGNMYRIELSTEVDDYELFRRAIVERDEDAWAAIHVRYRSLLISWSRRCSAAFVIGEPHDAIADQALARAWMALSPRHFARFSSLSRLLAYLRTCVVAVVIDYSRAQTARERTLQKLEVGALATPEQIVLEDIERSELWLLISRLAEIEHERVVLVESFVFDLPPRVILARHPELFKDVSTIYFAKRNLLARLQRNPDIQRLRRELLSV